MKYSTDHFQLASYLLSLGFQVTHIDRGTPSRVIFTFEGDENVLRNSVKGFIAFEALVEPHRFASAQKELKQIIYS